MFNRNRSMLGVAAAYTVLIPSGPFHGAVHLDYRTQQSRLTCAADVAPSDSGGAIVNVIAVGRGGRLAWTDGRPGQVLVRDGRRRVRSIGRSGSGPGEFRVISTMGWLGDTLWVGDASLPRVQLFTDTGTYVSGITAQTRASWALQRGELVGFASRRLAADHPYAVLRQAPGRAVDTIATFPLVPAPRFELSGGGRNGNPQPFAPETVVGASPDHSRFCGARPSADVWQLVCFDSRGTLTLRTNLSLTGRPLSDAVYDSVVAIFSKGRSEAEVLRVLQRPRSLPAATDMVVSDEGDIWLRRTHRVEPRAVWWRVDREGRRGEEVSVGQLSRLLVVTRDSAWGVSEDDNGFETLMRCAIRQR